MRLLPSLLVFALAICVRLSAQNPDFPTVSGTIPAASIVANAGAAIDLRNFFSVVGITGQIVQFTTVSGTFNVEMNAVAAPNTVANFLAYVTANRFSNSVVHRSNPGFRIIQGGGYFLNGSNLTPITENAPIPMEAGDTLTHTRGTIAMARLDFFKAGTLDTAASEWFINTADNSGQWSPASTLTSNSYAAFGRVTGTGMSVVDAIAALPVPRGTLTVIRSSTADKSVSVDGATLPTNFGAGWGLLGSSVESIFGTLVTLTDNANRTISTSTPVTWSRLGSPFDELPILTSLPPDNNLVASNLVTVSKIQAAPLFPTAAGTPSVVTFSVVSSDPIVNAWVTGSTLHLVATKNLNRSSTVTVTATDSNGNAASTSFNVNVSRKVRDLNGDSLPDLVFQNTGTGQVYAWFLDGTGASINFSSGSGINSTGYLYAGSLGGWQLVAMGDLDGDGIPDLVFQNTGTGQVYAWFLNGTGASINFSTGSGIKSAGYLYGGSLVGWRLAGIADVNGDGKADLVFQNSGTGQVYAWFLDGSGASINFSTGSGIKGTGYLYGGSLVGWQLAGVGDLNGDGIPDLVFQNTSTGQIYAYALDDTGDSVNFTTGSGTKGSGYIYGGNLVGWRLAGIGDMNGDGIPDLLFQNTGTGQVYAWFLDGSGASVNFTTGSGLKGASYLYGGSLPGWQLY